MSLKSGSKSRRGTRIGLSLVLLVTDLACGGIEKPAAATGPGTPFAVVELFTSEGCSSCPPADALLAKLHAEARREGRRIFPLAFHVDYWDGLGWRDPYGGAAHSHRQRQYVQALDLSSSYTPQMIVNGREEFVGSDEKRARREIELALSRPAGAELFLRADPDAQGDGIGIEYRFQGETAGTALNLVLTESRLTSEVDVGENAGRNPKHECVVRRFETIELEGASGGRFEMELPHRKPEAGYEIVGYLQDPRSMRILGATRIDLPSIPVQPGELVAAPSSR